MGHRMKANRFFYASVLLAAAAAATPVVLAATRAGAVDAAPADTLTPPPEPPGYRLDDYRKPVPATLKGAIVVTAAQAEPLWDKNSAIFIDVYPQAPKPANLPAGTYWRDPPHYSIERAKWLPNVGYGGLNPQVDAYFRATLKRLTAGDTAHPLVMFCVRNCWMSWNAAKRALEYGYRKVYWFSEGTDAWQEAGLPMEQVKPEP